MKIGRKSFFFIIFCIGAVIIYSFLKNTDALEGANQVGQASEEQNEAGQLNSDEPAASPAATSAPEEKPTETPAVGGKASEKPTEAPVATETPKATETPVSGAIKGDKQEDGMTVLAEPDLIAVLVNKQYKLPENYNPTDLVYPDVRFLFDEKIEKRMMRKEAAAALERMFEAAEEDGIMLAGVSAYRSHKTQTALFQRYVKKDGMEKALTYSAYPGTSEHETGLAIDVSGSSGKCAVADCFADTKESDWLKKHVFEYGFIIRYPEGKEKITGYQYEPWHLRYVGTEVSKAIGESGDSLEEYYGAVPVSK